MSTLRTHFTFSWRTTTNLRSAFQTSPSHSDGANSRPSKSPQLCFAALGASKILVERVRPV